MQLLGIGPSARVDLREPAEVFSLLREAFGGSDLRELGKEERKGGYEEPSLGASSMDKGSFGLPARRPVTSGWVGMVMSRASRVSRVAKYYGTRYTSASAACLLARLAIILPWPLSCQSAPSTLAGEPLRVVDFACGDGVLLAAVYKELEEELRAGLLGSETERLHRYLLEEGLWGFDVQPDPVRIAASRFSSFNLQASVKPQHLFVVPIGESGGHIVLGSLDLLGQDQLTAVQVPGERQVALTVPEFHLAIMNPPFTRSVGGNLAFGDFPSARRKALQKQLRQLLQNRQLEGAGQAGFAAAFLGLADQYLRPGGRLAMVLPKAFLSGVAWEKIRSLLLARYHVEILVASFEGPNAWNFSEKTSLSEVLLVARKHAATSCNSAEAFTVFANLWRRPEAGQEASSLASQLLEVSRQAARHRIDEPGDHLVALQSSTGQVGDAYSARLRGPRFGQYQLFAQGALNRTLALLRTGVLSIPTVDKTESLALTSLGQFVEVIGPDVKQVHTAFRLSQSQCRRDASSNTGARYFSLWNHDSEQIRTMGQSANAILVPRDVELATRLWEQASASVLVTERAWLATVRVLAAMTRQPVLSNVWWPMRVRMTQLRDGSVLLRRRLGQLLVLWINSTPGMLLLLSQAETTRGPWVKFKKRPLHDLPVLDFTLLEPEEVESLCHVYDEVQGQILQPLPAEFAAPRVRGRIDGAFTRAIHIDVDLAPLYRFLARDPTVTGQSMPSASPPS